ncbi:hypothetical protein B1B04_18975 [Lysinibacillus sp. KCTC 33748]|uniref:hypothetical protein n=1 Tax=unclassified Lysinibacillus TaxID=2636778 RepID=UPI0009A8F441|nr:MULTISPECIES: hypothetical protein [unclassified Lysinibacillus]OXS70245.1 hypothetical protein B1B04_18975 [Lysinibacillus sp. KCTC 33748]SKC05177.1 hypothetical protein SAMN06295926_11984 [Lysinibacillus sp. AC-3]
MNTVSYKHFRSELRRLERLYLLTIYSYEENSKKVKIDLEEGNVKLGDELWYKDKIISRSPRELEKNLSVNYPFMLRESLLIRIVSIIEIYFQDVLKEISILNKNPFKDPRVKELKVASILEFTLDDLEKIKEEIVEEKIRKVVLGGISSIYKFIENTLKVNFDSKIINLITLEKLFDNRHLLVHAGGKIDSVYLKKYQMGNKYLNKKLCIDEEYFLNSLNEISQLILDLDEKIISKFDFKMLKEKQVSETEVLRYYEIQFKSSSNAELFLSEGYRFGFTKTFSFSDIAEKEIEIIDENKFIYRLKLSGEKEIVGTYLGVMRHKSRKGEIVSVNKL